MGPRRSPGEDTKETIHAHNGSRIHRDADRFRRAVSFRCWEPGPDVLSRCRFMWGKAYCSYRATSAKHKKARSASK
jgi:hypothetical protein